MNILIIGFQRSGTTLLRRLLQSHPQVDKIFHESFLLTECKTKQQLIQHVDQRGFDVNKGNWGEKVPYFPNLKKIPVVKYCEKWNRYFGKSSRILHIIRHPYDCAISNVKKFKHIHKYTMPLNLYRTAIPKALNIKRNVYTFKYEDMLINQDIVIPKIFEHCGLKSDIDFRQVMKKWENPRYQSIDPSRAFAYLEQNINFKNDLSSVIEEVNKIGGPKYEL